ncbi:ammonium transporter [Nocardioides campestrisoli]|uniref:ammonium transporter n=1 Tax=Nocardioides campestrisoli TaxID=2736757 RepID=UPI00163DB84B|nr:ammonium transporter [Nocardioides campestrisoli]
MDPTTAGNTAWLLTAVIAVVLMLPGLVLFYGGMVSRRTTTNMMMMVFGGFAVCAFIWVAFGYSVVFGNSVGGAGIIGNPFEFAGMGSLLVAEEGAGLPAIGLATIHLAFAGLTIGIVAGAAADRMKFGAWMVFAAIWVVLCYLPVAHWTFAFDAEGYTGGWLANTLGAVDYAGSTPIHVNSGIAALALAIVLGRRRTWPVQPKAHNLPMVLVGVGLLLTGWLGFDGSALGAADNDAAVAIFNTLVAACAGACAWLVVEKLRDGHATTLGACSGAIAALVAITPSCGTVSPIGALAIGVLAGVACYFAVGLKHRLGYDDALDVVALHLVGGIVGALAIGLLGHPDSPIGEAGLLYGGSIVLLGKQVVALVATCAWTFALTFVIATVLQRTIGIRVSEADERRGVDQALHAENAYEDTGELAHQPRGHAEQQHYLEV